MYFLNSTKGEQNLLPAQGPDLKIKAFKKSLLKINWLLDSIPHLPSLLGDIRWELPAALEGGRLAWWGG